MLMSKILHAITTLAVETTLPLRTTKQWTQAMAREELPKFTGIELAAEVAKVQEEMGRELRAVILEKRVESEKLAKEVQGVKSKVKEKLVLTHRYPDTCDQDFGHQSSGSTRSASSSISSPSFSTVTTFCDNCQKKGHGMGECWEFDTEEKQKALKNLRKHKCNRCGKFGHHENSCWDAFPEKKVAAMQWKANRDAQLQN